MRHGGKNINNFSGSIWIEYPRVAEFELGSAQLLPRRAKGHRAIETGAAPRMAGAGDLFDLDPDGILVAIDAHLDHALRMSGGLALFPQRLARSAEIPNLAGRYGLRQSLGIHMRDH